MKSAPLLLAASGAAVASLAAAVLFGSADLSPGTVLKALVSDADPTAALIVRELRLSRALTAFSCGALLALAGTLLQALTRNPLAEPYVLGVSGGAASAALLALSAGLALPLVHLSAAAGGAAAAALVLALAFIGGRPGTERLLLTGVVVASGFGALVTLVLVLAPPPRLPSMLFWLMGDLSQTSAPALPLVAAALALVLAWSAAPSLDVLVLGPTKAASLGVNVRALEPALLALAAIAVGITVTVAGSIGFVGLMAPHAARLMGAASHRSLVPAAALAGGTLLTLADTLARTVAAPGELPVGAITALIGVPTLLFLLRQRP